MKKTMKLNELLVDVQSLSKAANTIADETQGFENDLRRSAQCMAELNTFWKGNAAESFQNNIFIDFQDLSAVCDVFKKLSDDYAFAVAEYRKNEQKSIDIIKAIKEI